MIEEKNGGLNFNFFVFVNEAGIETFQLTLFRSYKKIKNKKIQKYVDNRKNYKPLYRKNQREIKIAKC